MLFDEGPKDHLKDLFAREEDIEKLEESVFKEKKRLVIISGIRRVGKTSLLKAFLNDKIPPFIYIDPRHLAPKDKIPKADVLAVIQTSLQTFLDDNAKKGKLEGLTKYLKYVRGFTVGEVGIELDFSPSKVIDLQALFLKLNEWAEENGHMVLSIDEAQEFAKAEEIDLTGILAYIYDNCKNITIILTGSEIGLLYDFLGFDKPSAYLYGRIHYEIPLEPLKPNKSKEFLIQGFKEKLMKEETISTEIIGKAVRDLDGILGWLVMFANKCLANKALSENSISETQEIGSKLASAEFGKYVARSGSNGTILNEIMKQAATVSQYKFSEINIGDQKRLILVNQLVKAGYLCKVESRYEMPDPLLLYAFQNQ